MIQPNRVILWTIVVFCLCGIMIFSITKTPCIQTPCKCHRKQIGIESSPLLEFLGYDPETTRLPIPNTVNQVIIDVGQHVNPIVPSKFDEMVIGFEPLRDISEKLNRDFGRRYPGRFYSICAGVSDENSVSIMRRLGFSASSSFARVNKDTLNTRTYSQDFIHSIGHRGSADTLFKTTSMTLTPVFRLEPLLEAIHKPIVLLKIDAQGVDLKVLKGCGNALKKVRRVRAEVEITKNKMYENAPTEDEIMHHMTSMGFRLQQRNIQSDGKEADLEFVNMF